jgi:glutamate-1-semialdehyde 2,1-aminomutase
LTRDAGALLIIDEAHTQVAAYGGFTRLWRLQPDILTLGKCLGGGIPVGAYGVTPALQALIEAHTEPQVEHGLTLALGGTTYGSALTLAAVRATLEQVLTEAAYARVAGLGARLADGIDAAFARHGLPWRAHRLGNRAGLCLGETLPRNAVEASARLDEALNLATRAFMANRGVWEPIYIHGPSISFAHTEADVDRYLDRLDEWLHSLLESCS